MRIIDNVPTFGNSLPDRQADDAPEWRLKRRRVVVDDLMNDHDYNDLLMFITSLRVDYKVELDGWEA